MSYLSLTPLQTVGMLRLELRVIFRGNDRRHSRIILGTKGEEGGKEERRERGMRNTHLQTPPKEAGNLSHLVTWFESDQTLQSPAGATKQEMRVLHLPAPAYSKGPRTRKLPRNDGATITRSLLSLQLFLPFVSNKDPFIQLCGASAEITDQGKCVIGFHQIEAIGQPS